MVTHDTAWTDGTPCWVDLGVPDVGKAGDFYSGLFGWDVQPGPPEAGGYAICVKGGRAVAGLGPKQSPDRVPPAWTTYLATSDADETVAKIRGAGGEVLTEPMDVLDAGRLAVAADPAGAVFGVWQAGSHTGVGLANEPGALAWNENMSRDFDGNKAFYHTVFGYDYGDIGEAGFRYSTLKVGPGEVGGIGELDSSFPAEIPPHWSVYFAAGDTDAAARTVVSLGGRVEREPWDTPYGRMAIVTDSQGAFFNLISMVPAGTG